MKIDSWPISKLSNVNLIYSLTNIGRYKSYIEKLSEESNCLVGKIPNIGYII